VFFTSCEGVFDSSLKERAGMAESKSASLSQGTGHDYKLHQLWGYV
jgi:hypothetical protein